MIYPYDLTVLANQSLTVLDHNPLKSFRNSTKEGAQYVIKLDEYLENSTEEGLFYLAANPCPLELSPTFTFWKNFAHHFSEKVRLNPDLENQKEDYALVIGEKDLQQFLNEVPFSVGSEYITADLLLLIWGNFNRFLVQKAKEFEWNLADLFHHYAPDSQTVGKIFFNLVEYSKEELNFAFMATYIAGSDKKGHSKHKPLKYALTEFENEQEKLLNLLVTVNKVSEKSATIKTMIADGSLFHPISFDSNQTFNFLKETPLYEEAGISCRLPKWWKKKPKSSSIQVKIGEKKKKLFGMDSLVDFNIGIAIGDETITAKEAQDLLNQSDGLAFLKGKWLSFDRDELAKTLEAWKEAKKLIKNKSISMTEALQYLMNPDRLGLDLSEDVSVQVDCGNWLESVLGKMRDVELVKEVKVGKEFKAELRPYQQKGLNWLMFFNSVNLGACLADDMGLGKTIQVLSLIDLFRKKKKNHPSLLVLPASLILNWSSEIDKFAPGIKYGIAHASSKDGITAKTDITGIDQYDLVLTSYGLVKKYENIKEYHWNYVILDEAQAIKNAGSQQTKAIKKLNCQNRLVLTGTPIENSLSDLWSLFDFVNPGLLGNLKKFKEFVNPKKNKTQDLTGLRNVISPYILRRMKTDKKVISDLPDKVEMECFSTLSKKQVVLYKKLVDGLKASLEEAEGIKRRGLILSSLIKFKQICNHSDHYLGQTDYEEKDSGKFKRLREICETVLEKREKILIFTQFKEISKPLSDFLEEIFGREGLVLHGGTSIKKRKEYVDRFQSDEYVPYFVLSLKAGGTGLNLTAANHVVHFDRWWNPAVENQASDRAFRIGQKKNVMIHKFITRGTLEEKISVMLKDKQALSDDLLKDSNEKWITEMDNKDILELFKLGV